MIDAHQHFWTADYFWLADPELKRLRRDYTVEDLRPHLEATGVQHTVLVEAARCTDAETTEFLALAGTTPEIAGVVGYASLAGEKLVDVIDGHRAGPGGHLLVGIRDQIQAGPDDVLDRPEVRAGLTRVARAGLVNELVIRAEQLPAVERAVATLPDARFVLDHLGKPPIAAGELDRWRRMITPVARQENVVAKLSGLVTEAGPGWTVADLRPYVETALDLFGPDRLMFGSDWPVCELVATYEQVADALTAILGGRPGTVFGGTAARVYGLELP